MITKQNHTCLFKLFLFASLEIRDYLRPMMDIITDPECSVRQREVAFNYVETWLVRTR